MPLCRDMVSRISSVSLAITVAQLRQATPWVLQQSSLSFCSAVRPVSVEQRYVDMVASTEGRSKDTTVVRLAEGNELPMFTGLFGSWHPIKLGVSAPP